MAVLRDHAPLQWEHEARLRAVLDGRDHSPRLQNWTIVAGGEKKLVPEGLDVERVNERVEGVEEVERAAAREFRLRDGFDGGAQAVVVERAFDDEAARAVEDADAYGRDSELVRGEIFEQEVEVQELAGGRALDVDLLRPDRHPHGLLSARAHR